MKLRISTALLVTSLVGVCIGWSADRIRWRSERNDLAGNRKTRGTRIHRGTASESGVRALQQAISKMSDADQTSEEIRRLVVARVFDVFENASDIEFVSLELHGRDSERENANIIRTPRALTTAKPMLTFLKCNSADEFLEIAKSLPFFDNPELCPHFHDVNSETFQEFHQFLSDAILYEHPNAYH